MTSSSFKGQVVGTIALPYTATITYPVISGDGSTLYVSVTNGNRVQVIDTASATITGSFTAGTYSHSMVMSPDDSTLYVGTSLNGSESMHEYDTASETLNGGYGLYRRTFSQRMVITPDESKVYAASRSSSNGVIRYTTSDRALYGIPSTTSYYYMDAALAGTKLFCTDAVNDTLRVINTTTDTLASSITDAGFNYPWDLLASADGSTIYTFNNGGSSGRVIDVATETVTGTINSVGQRSSCWNPEKTHIFLGGTSSVLQVIDAADEEVVETYSIGTGYCGMVWHPNGKTLYSTNSARNAIQIIQ